MNKVILIGNLTKDVELKTTNTGKSVVSTSIATNKSYIDKSGERKQITNFHNLVIWGKQAEVFAKYLHKGSKVAVVGELQNRDYVGNDNIKRYVVEIRVNEVEFLDTKPVEKAVDQDIAPKTANTPDNFQPQYVVPEKQEQDIQLDDIPF